MIKGKNIKASSFISNDNQIENHNLLIQKLKESYELQKQFIKEIKEQLQFLINNEFYNGVNLNSSSKNFMDEIPFIIKDLGIPFAHNFFHNNEIKDNLMRLYYDKIEKNDEKFVNKIKNIFEACMNIFHFSESNVELNKFRENLLDMQIIKAKNKILDNPKEEEKIYEEYNILLNELNSLKEIYKEKEKIEELEKKYKNFIKEINIFSTSEQHKNSNLAEIQFFNELIQEIDEFFKKLNLSPPKDINFHINTDNNITIKEEKINLNPNKKAEEIKFKPLDQRTSFYLNEKIKERRNEVIEFKNYHFPLTFEINEKIKQLICGFLNSKGGRLYIGIDGQNLVKGVVLDSKARDDLRRDLVNLTYDFYPSCRTNKILVYFIPVKDAQTQKFIRKNYIIKLRVYPGDIDVLYSMTSKGYHSTIRRGDQLIVLNSTQIYKEIESRDDLKAIKNQDNAYIKELRIRDPEPEKNDNEDDYEQNLDFFGEDRNENLKENIKTFPKKNEKKFNYKKKDNINGGNGGNTFIVKITNIDESKPKNEVNRLFNDCKRYSQEILDGYGFLYFSNLNDANNCIARFNGFKLGNKKLQLNLTYG